MDAAEKLARTRAGGPRSRAFGDGRRRSLEPATPSLGMARPSWRTAARRGRAEPDSTLSAAAWAGSKAVLESLYEPAPGARGPHGGAAFFAARDRRRRGRHRGQ